MNKIVPIEPTEEMIQDACLRRSNTQCKSYQEWVESHEYLSSKTVEKFRAYVIDEYKKMLSAAPESEYVAVPKLVRGDTTGKLMAWMAFIKAMGYEMPRNDDGTYSGTFSVAINSAIDAYLNTDHNKPFKIALEEARKFGTIAESDHIIVSKAEYDALKADAERYRWLRSKQDLIGTDDLAEFDIKDERESANDLAKSLVEKVREKIELQAKLDKARELLKESHCPNKDCNNNGVIAHSMDDIEECQFCYERKQALKEIE
jgi:hypothetical protein